MAKVITVGELRKALGGAQDHVPVRINISTPGDARKKHSPWIDGFYLTWSENEGASVVVIYGTEVEI